MSVFFLSFPIQWKLKCNSQSGEIGDAEENKHEG